MFLKCVNLHFFPYLTGQVLPKKSKNLIGKRLTILPLYNKGNKVYKQGRLNIFPLFTAKIQINKSETHPQMR